MKNERETQVHVTTYEGKKNDLYVSSVCKECYSTSTFDKSITDIIECGTGKGKSYMVVRHIIPEACKQGKKILLLCNRSKLLEQYEKDILDAICDGLFNYSPCIQSLDGEKQLYIMTYQALENQLCENEARTLLELDSFDIVIADEIHYLLTDSTFNPKTQVSAEALLLYLRQKRRYFISATMENIKPFILYPEDYIKPQFTPENRYCQIVVHCNLRDKENSTYNEICKYNEYAMETDYGFLDVKYYNGKDVIIDYMLNSSKNEKWLYFVPSKGEGEKIVDTLNKRYKKQSQDNKVDIACFVSADYRTSKDSEMSEAMDYITNYNDTNHKILVTTSVLDNGISLKSKKLLNVIIDVDNEVTFKQMLGRKRLMDGDERVNLYIPVHDKQYFERRQNIVRETIRAINQINITDLPHIALNNLCIKQDSPLGNLIKLVYWKKKGGTDDNHFTVNLSQMSYYQMKSVNAGYQNIIDGFKEEKEIAFIKTQLSWLNKEYNEDNWLKDNTNERVREQVEEILSEYVDCELTEREIEELLEKIKNPLRKIERLTIRSNRITTSSANKVLNDINSKYLFQKNKIILAEELSDGK